ILKSEVQSLLRFDAHRCVQIMIGFDLQTHVAEDPQPGVAADREVRMIAGGVHPWLDVTVIEPRHDRDFKLHLPAYALDDADQLSTGPAPAAHAHGEE